MELDSRYPIALEQALDWGDQDALGHINNVVYFRYLENVRVEYFRRIGLQFPAPGTGGHGPILANAQCTFLRPLTYPDRIRIEAGVSRIGSSSFTQVYRIHSQAQQALVAEAQSVAVFYDYGAGRSAPLTEELRRAILELEKIPV